MKLDRIDRHILSCLQRDNQITNVNLAQEVGLSPPACLRRVKALRSSGMIEADVSLLSQKALGRKISVVVGVTMARGSSDVLDAFKRKMLATPAVTQCYLVTGDVDFILMVQVEDMEAYQAFLERLLYDDATVKEMNSLVVVNRVKFLPNPAIEI